MGPSTDGTLQFTVAGPAQQSLQPSQIRSVTHSPTKGGSDIFPVSISTETTRATQLIPQEASKQRIKIFN